MADFPWQKKDDDSGDALRWDSRMPWQTDPDGAAGGDAADDETSGARPSPGDPEPVLETEPARAHDIDPDEAEWFEETDDGETWMRRTADEPLRPEPDPLPEIEDEEPFVPAPPPADAERTVARASVASRVVIFGFLGAIVLAGLVGWLSTEPWDSGPAPHELTAEEEAAAEEAMTEGAETFLNALAAGDAEAAIAATMLGSTDATENGDRSLLTDEHLAASLAVAPISDISVSDAEVNPSRDWEGTVRTSFARDGDVIDLELSMWAARIDGVRTWVVSGAFDRIHLSDVTFGALTPRINGQEVPTGRSMIAFPGVYELTLDEPHLDADRDDLFDTTDDGTTLVTVPLPPENGLGPGFTADGESAYLAAAQEAIDTCLASRDVIPPCVDASNAALVDKGGIDGTVTRAPSDGVPFEIDSPRYDYENPQLVDRSVFWLIEAEGTCEGGDSCSGLERMMDLRAEFDENGDVTIAWREHGD